MIGLLEYVKIGSERVKASLNLNVLEQTIDLSVTRAYFILCVTDVEWGGAEKDKMAREFSPPCPPFLRLPRRQVSFRITQKLTGLSCTACL